MAPTADPRPGAAAAAVVVPHLNQPAALRRCLAALAAGTVRPREVVVADNGSDPPPPADLWGLLPGARLVHAPEPGPGPARNAGAAATHAPLLAFLDSDCLPAPDWLQRAVEAHRAAPRAVLGGAVQVPAPDRRGAPAAAYEALYAFRMDRYVAREGFAGAGNMAVPRTVWDAVGPMRGVGCAEDRDWGRRATAQGHPLRFVASMRATHPARPSLAALRAKWDRQIAHDFAALARGGRLRWAVKALALPLSVAAELPRVLLSPRLRGAGVRLDALEGLLAVRLHRARRMLALLVHPAAAAGHAARWNRG
ncbi:glycosyltransferase family 2 protein [Jannaschia sp. W003]|uniref:glycosyltransferase family 2 protein n=1 Tax=Jannaschia sp. W003 TaxID=2867012 RepID=UPI0021A4408F|nr:glycosyltransferase [Jannaschia sp. W003]UWQ21850.1 glycosyltransferase [Jannaschia sp. W003]